MVKIEIINHERNRFRITDSTESPPWRFDIGSVDDKDHADPALRNRRTVTEQDLARLRTNKVFKGKESEGLITVYGA